MSDDPAETFWKEESEGPARSNGLAHLAGTWTAEEHREFEENVAPFEEIDDELWQ
ncbi:MAG TPA: hypothetical protein VN380_05160 [Thermoanaerobaculia bacterium]|jgi:hypothetical protein|nr:hypothetical protein [Thermoanaerobaculia bacterium]